MNSFRHNYNRYTTLTTASKIIHNTNRNLPISNITCYTTIIMDIRHTNLATIQMISGCVNVNMIIMIHFVAMTNPSISNISTTTSTTINIDYITPPTSTFDALQSNSITNLPMMLNFVISSKSCCINQSQQTILWQLYSTITIDLTEIDFAKLLIKMSPAIARLDNFDDRNLGNNLTTTDESIII